MAEFRELDLSRGYTITEDSENGRFIFKCGSSDYNFEKGDIVWALLPEDFRLLFLMKDDVEVKPFERLIYEGLADVTGEDITRKVSSFFEKRYSDIQGTDLMAVIRFEIITLKGMPVLLGLNTSHDAPSFPGIPPAEA